MINFETVKFIAILNSLAAETANGFMDFYSTDDANKINEFNGILYNSKDNNKIILSKLVMDGPNPVKDIISYYDDTSDDDDTSKVTLEQFNCSVKMCEHTQDEEKEYGLNHFLYVDVVCKDAAGHVYDFVIRDGKWYYAL